MSDNALDPTTRRLWRRWVGICAAALLALALAAAGYAWQGAKALTAPELQQTTEVIGRSISAELERALASANDALAAQQASRRMLKEEVDEEDVAEVVAAWTGIPLNRLLEGEVEKLLHMEERLHERVIGQDDAKRRAQRCITAVQEA